MADSVGTGAMMPATAAQRLLFLLDNKGADYKT
jgi:hypothetical protein